jgi:multidrug efflux pump subunit AcrB
MWLVNAALRHPYTVYVGMLLVAVLGLVSYRRTPTDILPQIKVPVVVVFVSYRGMPAPDMEQSITAPLERALTRCDHLEHIESRSLLGIGIIKIAFRPQVDPDVAASQVISLVNSEMQNLPPGMLPPTVLKYDASSIPVGNLIITSATRDDKELLDIADHQVREELATVEGLASAPVFGGVFRQVQIYVHPRTLEALKLSPMDVARIVNAQSQVIPTGEIRIGDQNYYVSSNAMVETPREFEKIPLYSDGRKIVYLGDVGNVLDATRWRTNTVHVDGRRAVYMPLLRQAGASAVRVVDNVQAFLPQLHLRGTIPDDVQVSVAFDQSQYVRDALYNLRMEALGGAVLASLVVLLFLGSLRSTWIVALSIPLSVLAAFVGLYFTGHTLNIMTLGGLALILGRVVDDSIVDVENTVRHLNLGKDPLTAARDSANEISVPVLMATITTVVVFFPITFMAGLGKYLFTPLAASATMAMFASYVVSRTVSPLYCSRYLLAHGEPERFPRWLFVTGLLVAAVGLGVPALAAAAEEYLPDAVADVVTWPFVVLPEWARLLLVVAGTAGGVLALCGVLFRAAPWFDRFFERLTAAYERALRLCLRRRLAVVGLVVACLLPAVWCFLHTGRELFPEVDASEFTVHLRLTGGPRVEATEQRVSEIQKLIREGFTRREKLPPNLPPEEIEALVEDGYTLEGGYKEIKMPPMVPEEDLEMILSNMGVSSRWSAIYTPNNGPHAAFIRVQLRSGFNGRHVPTLVYVERLRRALAELYPGDDFFFETGGMIRRILNADAVAPIEVRVHGRDAAVRRALARQLDARIQRIPQVKDTYAPQGMDLPQLRVDVDRTAAARLKLTETDVLRNVITALMSSAQLAPNFWIDPVSGNPYVIGVQYPERLVENKQTLENVPVSPQGARTGQRVTLLKEVADIQRTQGPIEVYHHDIERISQIFVSVGDNDLAGVAAEIERLAARAPADYLFAKLPAERREAAAANEWLRGRLEAYFDKPTPAARAELRTVLGVDPEAVRLPPGMRVTVHGEVSSMRESFQEMAFNLALAVLLVYLVMAAQFASWLDPLIMITAAPLGLIGVGFTLWLTGTSLNIQSCMGVLMMVGISVSNSVLVVEFANRQRAAGHGLIEAAVSACRIRLRPILMTTVATVAGLTPMALHLHPGDEMNLPLARAVIGGITGSTLLTLFVVPVLYVLLKPRQEPAALAPEPGTENALCS